MGHHTRNTTDAITRKAHCGGCGGPRTGQSWFELCVMDDGTPLPVWACRCCGHAHRMRGGWPVMIRKLRAAGADGLADKAEAEMGRRWPVEASP